MITAISFTMTLKHHNYLSRFLGIKFQTLRKVVKNRQLQIPFWRFSCSVNVNRMSTIVWDMFVDDVEIVGEQIVDDTGRVFIECIDLQLAMLELLKVIIKQIWLPQGVLVSCDMCTPWWIPCHLCSSCGQWAHIGYIKLMCRNITERLFLVALTKLTHLPLDISCFHIMVVW